jgi:hypothetical protein
MHGRDKNAYTVLVRKCTVKRDHLEDLSIEYYNGSSRREVGWEGGMDWMHLAQDRDQWQTLLNTIMNLKRQGIY